VLRVSVCFKGLFYFRDQFFRLPAEMVGSLGRISVEAGEC